METKFRKAFTLFELISVFLVISVITSFGIYTINLFQKDFLIMDLKETAKNMIELEEEIALYNAKENSYIENGTANFLAYESSVKNYYGDYINDKIENGFLFHKSWSHSDKWFKAKVLRDSFKVYFYKKTCDSGEKSYEVYVKDPSSGIQVHYDKCENGKLEAEYF